MPSKVGSLWRNLLGKSSLDKDLDQELRAHRQLLADEKIRDGMDPATAYRQAAIELGGVEQVKEGVRQVRIGNTLDNLLRDFRQAARNLQKNFSTTILATLMLALGIGATTLIFSVFYSVLLQPLPFSQPERLVQISETRLQKGWEKNGFMEANFWDIRQRNRSFLDVGAINGGYGNGAMVLTGFGDPENTAVAYTSAQFFSILGVNPALGRLFYSDEDQPGHNRQVILLENKYWKTRFGGSPKIIGQSLHLDGRPYQIVGILPPGEPWLDSADVFIPMSYSPDADRGSFEYAVIGRLLPGVSRQAAQADLQTICTALAQEYPLPDAGMGAQISSSEEWGANRNLRRALWVLLGAVGFLLLIACVNLANLLLAKATARSREIVVRAALGASKGRLVQLVLCESLLLGTLGAACGLLLAKFGLAILRTSDIAGVPHLTEISLSGLVLSFTLLTTLAVSLLSGLFPALETPFKNLAAALREGDRSQAGSRSHTRLRATLVTIEVALSFVLLVGAGLLVRSFDQLLRVDRGFHSEHRLFISVNLPGSYDRNRLEDFLRRYPDRVSHLPGVLSAAAVNTRPIIGRDPGMGIVSEEQSSAQLASIPWSSWRFITPDYFRTMSIPLLKGREFNSQDRKGAPWRVVISQKLAELLWPGQDPIGRHAVLWKGQGDNLAEVIGVVGNIRDHGLDSDPTRIVYIPYYGTIWTPLDVVVQTAGTPTAIVPALRTALAEYDATLPISDIRTGDELVATSLGPQRLNVSLLALFAAIALVLSMTGIYGVLAYSVAKRTAEIGVRVALGASHQKIFQLVIAQGMKPVIAGIVIGLAGAMALSRFMMSLLFGVSPADAITYVAVAVMIAFTALVSCYVPARRALTINPVTALREE